MVAFPDKVISNITKVQDIFERQKINSVRIINTNKILDTSRFDVIKKEIHDASKNILGSYVYININIIQKEDTKKEMELEINPFIGSA